MNDYCLNIIVNMAFVSILRDTLGVELISSVIDLVVMLVMVAISRLLSDYLKGVYKRFFVKIMKKLKK